MIVVIKLGIVVDLGNHSVGMNVGVTGIMEPVGLRQTQLLLVYLLEEMVG